jgi:translation elongation factor EF-4
MITGFEDVKPMVFAGIYPVDTEDYEELRASMEKLQLNDASLVFTARKFGGFRIWFPLWIFRNVTHGNYSGTIGTRVQYDRNYYGS